MSGTRSSGMHIRVNPEIKAKAEQTFSVLGLNLSEAINVFLHMSIKHYGFPFQVTDPVPNKLLQASLDEADAILANPSSKGYTTVAELNAAMDAEDATENENV